VSSAKQPSQRRLSTDSWSAGLAVAFAGMHVVHAIDEGIFVPWSYQFWRWAVGDPLLPLDLGKSLLRAATGTSRMIWVCLGVSLLIAVAARRILRTGSYRSGNERLALWVTLSVTFLVPKGVAWPTSRAAWSEQSADALLSCVAGLLALGVGEATVRAMKRFAVEGWRD